MHHLKSMAPSTQEANEAMLAEVQKRAEAFMVSINFVC